MSGPLAGKRIGLLAGWASRKNGGVFEAMVGQAKLIRELGGEPLVFAARDEFSTEDSGRFGCKVFYSDKFGPTSLAYAPGLDETLQASDLDCLHLHGIWQGSSLIGARWARQNEGRYIISPHGMLDPWITGRGRLKKLPFWWLIERANLRSAATIHALTKDELKDIRRWVRDADARIVRNPAPKVATQRTHLPPPTVLYLGRIHDKKNIGALIEAWRIARPQITNEARLVIAGWGDDASIDALNHTVLRTDGSVQFVGAAFGSQKQALLDHARFLILPSKSEGLPMAILEAWAAGTPTIQTEACHLPEGPAAGCAPQCEPEPSSIARAIVEELAEGE